MLVIRSFFKALAIAAVSGALFFFLGIFLTLITLLIVSSVTTTKPDLTISYRIVGATASVTAFVLGFFGTIIFDVRRASRTTS